MRPLAIAFLDATNRAIARPPARCTPARKLVKSVIMSRTVRSLGSTNDQSSKRATLRLSGCAAHLLVGVSQFAAFWQSSGFDGADYFECAPVVGRDDHAGQHRCER